MNTRANKNKQTTATARDGAPRRAKARASRTSTSSKRATTMGSEMAQARATAADLVSRYGIQGAAALASGAALATGYRFRDPLGKVASSALHSLLSNGSSLGSSVAKQIDVASLLEAVGLRKRRSSLLGWGLGVLGGVAAASAIAYFVGPMILGALGEEPQTRLDFQPNGIAHPSNEELDGLNATAT